MLDRHGRGVLRGRSSSRHHWPSNADVWFEPSLVLEVLGDELPPRPTTPPAWPCAFPRFTGRYRDDREPEDATTVRELADLYHLARVQS